MPPADAQEIYVESVPAPIMNGNGGRGWARLGDLPERARGR